MKAFGSYNPLTLFLYFLSVILISAFLQNPVLTVSALCGAILFSAALSRRRERLSDIAFYIPLFLLVTVTNPLFSHNGQTPLFFLNGTRSRSKRFFTVSDLPSQSAALCSGVNASAKL